jgi:hypothetical protein
MQRARISSADRAGNRDAAGNGRDYLRLAGIALRAPEGLEHHPPAKPATEVITGFLPSVAAPAQGGQQRFGSAPATPAM